MDKYNLGTVGGMAVTELWSGSVGNLTGRVDKAKITLNDEYTEKVMSLIEALEDIDDVSDVYHNLDI